ncbi:MAG: S41 family peptidase [Bacteroidota bacterium]
MKQYKIFSIISLIAFFSFLSPSIAQDKALVKGNSLSLDSLRIDIDFLEKAMTEIHPGIYRYNSPDEIKQHFKGLRASLYEGISEAEFMKKMAQMVVKIRCGHTYLNPWNMKKSIRQRLFGGETFFPLGFRIIDKRFYVTYNTSEVEDIKAGAEILSINGISTQVIYDSLYTIGRSDGNNFSPIPNYLSLKDFRERGWEAFDLYYPLFFPLKTTDFAITYLNAGKKTILKANLQGLSKKERAQRLVKRYGEDILDQKKWRLDLSNPQVAVMRLGTFAIWNWKDFDHKKWFADAFAQINTKKIPNLIVDIRGNGGGLGEPKDELISYLIREKLICGQESKVLIRATKVDPILKPYSDTWVKVIFEGLPSEMYRKYNEDFYELLEKSECQDISPKEKGYRGNVYLFGGPSNVSATFNLLNQAKQNKFGKFIGSTSGGNQQGINGGDYIFFYLPYSGMEVDIPLKFFSWLDNPPDTGVAPDVEISYRPADLAENRDPFLEYVLEQIK